MWIHSLQIQTLQSLQKDGYVLFARSTEKERIRSLPKTMQVFYTSVAKHVNKVPGEIGNLVGYTHNILKLTVSCNINCVSNIFRFRKGLTCKRSLR